MEVMAMRTRAITGRIMNQLRRDKRTLALVIIAPLIVLSLVYFILDTGTTSYNIGIINSSTKLEQQIKKNDDYDITVKKYSVKSDALDAIKSGDIIAAVDANKDSSRVKIYLDGSNSSDAARVKGVITQSTADVVKKAMKSKISDIKKATAAIPAASSVSIDYIEPDVTTDYIYGKSDGTLFDNYGVLLIGIIIFFFVFLIAGINFLDERTGGTLERLLSTPVRIGEIIGGYVLGFGILATVQTIVVSLFVVYILGLDIGGSIWYILLINLLTSLTALTLGMLLSTLATSQFQMIQFIPLVILPQVFLCGLFQLSGGWDIAGHFMPLYYTCDALTQVGMRGGGMSDIWIDCLVLLGCGALFMTMNIAFLNRQRRA